METIIRDLIRSIVRGIFSRIDPIQNDVAVIKTITPSLRTDIDNIANIVDRTVHVTTFNSAISNLQDSVLNLAARVEALEISASSAQTSGINIDQIVNEEIGSTTNTTP